MLRDEYAVFQILVQLPAVGRMNFLNVDREEVDAILIGAVDPIEGPSLGPERRSGVAAEDQGDGAARETLRKTNNISL